MPGVPSAPTAVDVLATSMRVVWNAPSTDGGTPVVGYHVERRSKISRHWVFLNKDPITDTSLVVKDLFEDMVYEYRVTAVNKMGAGKPSDPSLPITARNPWSQSLTYLLFMTALRNRADDYIFMLLFVLLSSLWSPYVIGRSYIFMVALCNRADHYIFALWLLSFYLFYFLA